MTPKVYILSEIIDYAITAVVGDKFGAERQREINRTIDECIAGGISNDECYKRLRFNDGDELDQLLGN